MVSPACHLVVDIQSGVGGNLGPTTTSTGKEVVILGIESGGVRPWSLFSWQLRKDSPALHSCIKNTCTWWYQEQHNMLITP